MLWKQMTYLSLISNDIIVMTMMTIDFYKDEYGDGSGSDGGVGDDNTNDDDDYDDDDDVYPVRIRSLH
jgi:hypothetical protein